jgi:predicted signal transduction protein with EAL and GGDEF domain
VLEPQSTALFVLLIVLFGVLTGWMVITRQPVFRLLAACLAFIPAMLFGVVAVNKYYGYYQTWGAAVADLSSQGGTTVAQGPACPARGWARWPAATVTWRWPSSRGTPCG